MTINLETSVHSNSVWSWVRVRVMFPSKWSSCQVNRHVSKLCFQLWPYFRPIPLFNSFSQFGLWQTQVAILEPALLLTRRQIYFLGWHCQQHWFQLQNILFSEEICWRANQFWLHSKIWPNDESLMSYNEQMSHRLWLTNYRDPYIRSIGAPS